MIKLVIFDHVCTLLYSYYSYAMYIVIIIIFLLHFSPISDLRWEYEWATYRKPLRLDPSRTRYIVH